MTHTWSTLVLDSLCVLALVRAALGMLRVLNRMVDRVFVGGP